MTNTTPTELARRIAAEKITIMERVDDDKQFRERTLITLAEINIKLDHISERIAEHEQDDLRQFTHVHQAIGGTLNLKQIGWTLAGITGLAGAATFLIWLAQQVKP